jgi:hypothetical protein
MAITLADEMRVEKDPLRKGVIQNLRMSSPIAELATIRNINDLHTADLRWKTLPSVGFRGLNEGYTESTGTTDRVPVDLAFIGGDFDIDMQLMSNDAASIDMAATQLEMKQKALAYAVNNYFINGDAATDQRQFNGLKAILAQLSSSQTISAATDGLDVRASGTDADRYTFLDKLDECIWQVHEHRPDVLLMNEQTYRGVRSLLRRLKLLDTSRDQFDREIETYRGVRLVDIGFASDDATLIIPNNETQGAGGANFTSIYAVRFGDAYTSLIQKGGIQVRRIGELETKPVMRTRVEWAIAVGCVHKASMARLKGFRFV